MDNQHRIIKGYRELNEAEIALMNEVKHAGIALDELVEKVQTHVAANLTSAHSQTTNPGRWVSIARTDLQTGLMALTRAVAKPEFF
jgi:predicted transglutaminase-like cysteine proteinase